MCLLLDRMCSVRLDVSTVGLEVSVVGLDVSIVGLDGLLLTVCLLLDWTGPVSARRCLSVCLSAHNKRVFFDTF